MNTIQETRKSHVEHGISYFWTATINGWKHLLKEDAMKMEIIQSMQWLTERDLVAIYAYVIMPNHLHFIWTVKNNNGRESPQGSLLKFTAHQFRKILYQTNQQTLKEFEVSAANKSHEFWQRDSLAIPLYTRPFLLQKIGVWQNIPQHIDFPQQVFMKTEKMHSGY